MMVLAELFNCKCELLAKKFVFKTELALNAADKQITVSICTH